MELHNRFLVPVPVAQAWDVLTDLERIAPCMPGAQLQGVEGDDYRGTVKVKVGPITSQYRGVARFVERDDTAHRAILRAEGSDTRGQGSASATITATLSPEGDRTAVEIVTELSITGKVAQFGRGVLADVSGRLLDQFAQQLERDVLRGGEVAPSDASTEAVGSPGSSSPGSSSADGPAARSVSESGPRSNGSAEGGSVGTAFRSIAPRDVEPVDLLGAAGPTVAKRVLPLVGALVAALVVGWWVRRRAAR